jgi:hypothetical protein
VVIVCTPQAKHKPLKTQCFHLRTPGKKAMPQEIFPGNFTHAGSPVGLRMLPVATGKIFSRPQRI